MLTQRAHDAVRVCTPSTTPGLLVPAVLGTDRLDKAMDRYVRTVLDRAHALSIGDMRAVTRLLQSAGTHAAVVLERAQQAIPGAWPPRPARVPYKKSS